MNDRSRIILCKKMIKEKFLIKYQLIEICVELKKNLRFCEVYREPLENVN